MTQTKGNTFKTNLFYIVLFSLYMFQYSVSGTIIDHQSSNIRASGNTLYFIVQASSALGFIFFSISRKLCKTTVSRRNLLIGLSIIYVITILGLYYFSSSDMFSLCSLLNTFSTGYIGGAIYYFMSSTLYQNPYCGRIMAVSSSIAVMVQFLLQELFQLELSMIILLIVDFILLIYFILRHTKPVLFDDYLPYTRDTKNYQSSIKRKLLYTIILVFLYFIMLTLIENTYLYVNTYFHSFPRLFVILGYLFIGWTADIFGSRFLSVFGLCGMVICFVCTYSPEYTTLRFCLFYFTIGVFTGYFNLTFWYIAPKTKHPEFWASFGRILNVLEGVMGLFFIQTIGSHVFFATLALALLFISAIEFVIADLFTKYRFDDIGTVPEQMLLYLRRLSVIDSSKNTTKPSDTEKATISEEPVTIKKITMSENLSTSEKQTTTEVSSNAFETQALSEKSDASKTQTISEEPAHQEKTSDSPEYVSESTTSHATVIFTEFVTYYHLTPRESDVLRELLSSDDTMKLIAEHLGISERMLYRYMKNLYEKLGVETRAGIVKLYYESQQNEFERLK